MSSLFQPRIVRYILVDDQGEHRHRTVDGARVTKATPGAVKINTKSPTWWGQYRDAGGIMRQVALVKNKQAARTMLNELEVTARQAARGMVSSYEKHHKRPLVEHLADFEQAMNSRGSTTKQVAQVVGRARKVIDGCGFVFIVDLSASAVDVFLGDLRTEGAAAPPLPVGVESFTKAALAEALRAKSTTVAAIIQRHRLKGEGNGKARRFPRATAEAVRDWLRRGRGTQTIAHYLKAMKQFTRWLVKDRRMPANPLDHLSVEAPEADLRHDRRALTDYEMRALFTAARASSQAFRGMTGPERAILYATACATGFRAGELASLTPESFRLDGEAAYIALGASQSKNKRTAEQPLPADVAEALRGYLAGRETGSAVWPGTWHESAADMLRIDLAAAGVPYVVEGPDGPLFADFHSLRHSLCAMLDRSGATLKTAMQLMRHGTPTLTAKRYGRAQLHDLAGAVDKLPSLLTPNTSPTSEPMRATGTDGPARVAVALQEPSIGHERNTSTMRKTAIGVTRECHTVSPRDSQGLQPDETDPKGVRDRRGKTAWPRGLGLRNRRLKVRILPGVMSYGESNLENL